MAGYHIIHIENKWMVCFEQTRLISFDRKSEALKTMHTAARLIEVLKFATSDGASEPATILRKV